MHSSAIAAPLSDSAPCGPDLNASFDPEYEEYYFGAVGRLPGFYMQPGVERPDGSRSPDRIFDPKDVDHRAEKRALDALLARSRDLRLLVLQAQWDALAGRRSALAGTIETIATLLEQYPAEAHPALDDGGSERRDAINDLNQPVTMVQPLMFMGLAGTTEVTLRKIRASSGSAAPLQHEIDLELKPLLDTLAAPANASKVSACHQDFTRLSNALTRIEFSCKNNEERPFTPSFDQLRAVISEILQTLAEARPELKAAEADPPPPTETAAEEPAKPALQPPPVLAAPEQAPPPSAIVSHLHARRTLEACELYYRKAEPSSAALLLVTQARLLIGKPLVEALRALLPAQADTAVVDFGAPSGFLLGAGRLEELSNALPEGAGTVPELPQDPGPETRISTAAQAAQAIRSVEEFFRRKERSSPVPVLLQRAQSYLDKDFQSLIEELIPQAKTS
ncbi:type VI secretion system ImpA family N-terminal domain-containing protein [Leisingera sp. SS27]|uniref:type VI secretion system protein TssA n=1 Tax=Leisingera sp. SS27 TaxID=2979462 RepID=UPI00232EF719|nr:type VI secretion system ImpA family N-terminal domain-containing protein [Leisingera sp. SS27]MDC0659436.1 type VI secretion system ImpA family N-terminal domain-containing protein [Leisingera sp. SS27]